MRKEHGGEGQQRRQSPSGTCPVAPHVCVDIGVFIYVLLCLFLSGVSFLWCLGCLAVHSYAMAVYSYSYICYGSSVERRSRRSPRARSSRITSEGASLRPVRSKSRKRERESERATERQRVCVCEKKRAREKVNQSNPVAYTVDSLHIAYVSIPCVLRAWQQGHLDAVHKSPLHVQLIIGNSYNPSTPDLNKAWRNGSSATPSWQTWHSTTPRSSSPWRRVT